MFPFWNFSKAVRNLASSEKGQCTCCKWHHQPIWDFRWHIFQDAIVEEPSYEQRRVPTLHLSNYRKHISSLLKLSRNYATSNEQWFFFFFFWWTYKIAVNIQFTLKKMLFWKLWQLTFSYRILSSLERRCLRLRCWCLFIIGLLSMGNLQSLLSHIYQM